MKVKEAKVCGNCDEVYSGYACPSCGFEQGIPVRNSMMTLSGPGHRVRRVDEPHSEKIREIEAVQ